ncbi:von Willebrand factor type A domain-containing protein [Haloactinopolyspora alba]|uniref:von Willebrand factor type A domain-containing protein n=1 Tax=Haloactinopolyspora alba TaxID=648780 RepID=A0A2P8DXW8_9ACTN|nr:substrate-binding and VWA domain-containing protein [Haloactinopolyspora alba]PSL02075.1 von Willebrand factor type A domain-containing protein [Haloactinopolyspora alba]
MPGRHASARASPSSPWPKRLGLAVVAVATLGAAGLGVVSVVEPGSGGCDSTLPVTVAADPGIEPVLSELADGYTEAQPAAGDRCVEIDVTAAAPSDVLPTLGTDDAPDLWVPGSELIARSSGAANVERLASVALSPLVVAMPRAAASELGWPEVQLSWRDVLDGGSGALADPAATPEGLASLVAIRTALGDQVERAEMVQMMSAASQSVLPSVDTAFETVADGGPIGAFTALERDVVAHNRDAPQSPVVALYPSEGTLAFDYPALAPGGQASGTDETVRSAVSDFVVFLGGSRALETIKDAGFRAPDGAAAEVSGIVEGIQAGMPTLLPDPEPAAVAELDRQWAALTLDMRMLAVIDVSGSMLEQVGDGSTRIELTRDAALEAVRLFPKSSSVGLWAFSILQDPPRDHVELVDVGPLDEQVGDGTTRYDTLVGALESLPDRAEGGTGLYDTVLAAFQEVRSSYQPGKVNSVVLLTDGRNEDDPDGIDLATLLTTLTAQFDPAEPVPVITIGMGPEADMDALRQISEATGTTAYQARDPREIQQVFAQAMIERQCRPNC